MYFKDEIIIIRHGRSKYNAAQTTELDAGLTSWGNKQSKNVGKFLAKEMRRLLCHNWYTSPFLRCLETVVGITGGMCEQECYLESQIRVLPELREYLNHGGESVTVPNRSGEYTMFDWTKYESQNFDIEHNEVFLHRMHEFHHMLQSKSVVITHGLPAFVLRHIATDNVSHVPVWDYSMDNGSITWIKRGRVIWHGKNLYHEMESWPADCVYGKIK